MADHSFDIVSKIDLQELDNALNQTRRDVENRYDLKSTESKIEFSEKESLIKLESEGDYQIKAIYDILIQKLIKRGISPRALHTEKGEESSGGRKKQAYKLQQGISKEKSRDIVKAIKESKLKVQSQIQGEQVRVTAKKIDDLQTVMQLLKEADFGIHMSFSNYR